MPDEAAALVVRLEATAARFERDMRRAEGSFNRSARAIERRGQGLDTQLNRIGSDFGAQFTRLATNAGVIAGAAAIAAIGKAMTDVVQNGQKLALIEGRFTALTGSAERGADALQGVLSVSQRTGVVIDDVAGAMSRFTIAAQEIERSDEEVRQFTENLLQLGRIGGSSANEIANASVQLSQGLAAGALRGEELNSVLEGMPLVAQVIAEKLGVGIGALKEMGKEGRILADTVFEAVLSKTDDIQKKLESLPPSIEVAANRMAVAWTQFTAEIDKSLGASRELAGIINSIAAGMEGLAGARAGVQATSTRTLEDQRRALELEIANLELADTPDVTGARALMLRQLREQLDGLTEGYNEAYEAQRKLIREAGAIPPEPSRVATQRFEEPSDRPLPGAVGRAPRPAEKGFRGAIDIDADLKGRRGGGGRAKKPKTDDDAAELLNELRERITLLKEEASLVGASERRRVVLQAQYDRERTVLELLNKAKKDGSTITTEEIVLAENLAAGIEEVTIANYDLEEAYRRQTKAAERAAERQREFAESIADTSSRFISAIENADSFADALKNIALAAADLAIQGLSGQGPLGKILPSLLGLGASFAVGGGGGAGTGFFSGALLGGGGGTLTFSAKGNAFRGGRIIPFARGGIINRPAVFPMAAGIGLMGEAGPEGVLPLRRGRGGRLGVEASGGGGTVVNVYAPPGSDVREERTESGGMEKVDIFIQQRVARGINTPGSPIQRALSTNFGTRPVTTKR